MDLQNIFYLFAIIMLALGIIFFVVGIAVLWKLYDMVRSIPQKVEERVSSFVDSKAMMFVGSLSLPLISMIVGKLKKKYSKE